MDEAPPVEPSTSRRGRYDRSANAQQRSARARSTLVDATALALLDQGHTATVTDVVRLARVGRNTFYEHFPDLTAARNAVDERAADALDAHARARLAEAHTPLERLRALAHSFADAAHELPHIFSVICASDPQREGTCFARTHALLHHEVERAIAVGALPPRSVDVHVEALVAVFAALTARFLRTTVGQIPPLGDTLADFVTRCLR